MATPESIAGLLEGITGPFVVGTAVSTFLCGITLVQAYTYYCRFSHDRRIYQWMVYSLLLLDVVHTAFCWVTLWLWFVRHYGDAAEIAVSPWSFNMDPIMCGVAASIVQIFYAYRIYVFGEKSVIVPITVVLLSLFQLGWSSAASIKMFGEPRFDHFKNWTYGVACWLGGAALCDALVTINLVILLIKNRRTSSTAATNRILDRLIMLTVETNGLTFVTAVLDAIFFAARSDAAHVSPNLLLPKLYLNSLLVSLNSRTELSRNLGGSRSIHLSRIEPRLSSKSTDPVLSDESGVQARNSDGIRCKPAPSDEEASLEGGYRGAIRLGPPLRSSYMMRDCPGTRAENVAPAQLSDLHDSHGQG